MSTTSRKTNNEPAKPPVAKLRSGLVNGNIWERQTDKGTFHSVTFERRYRDDSGNWKSTRSFGISDLLDLAKLADQAHSKISEIQAARAA